MNEKLIDLDTCQFPIQSDDSRHNFNFHAVTSTERYTAIYIYIKNLYKNVNKMPKIIAAVN